MGFDAVSKFGWSPKLNLTISKLYTVHVKVPDAGSKHCHNYLAYPVILNRVNSLSQNPSTQNHCKSFGKKR